SLVFYVTIVVVTLAYFVPRSHSFHVVNSRSCRPNKNGCGAMDSHELAALVARFDRSSLFHSKASMLITTSKHDAKRSGTKSLELSHSMRRIEDCEATARFASNSRSNFLFLKRRREFNKAFSNLCRRPGRETEHECRLEFRLYAKKWQCGGPHCDLESETSDH